MPRIATTTTIAPITTTIATAAIASITTTITTIASTTIAWITTTETATTAINKQRFAITITTVVIKH